MVGAVALMASGPMLSLIDVADNYGSFAWLPWVMWSAAAPVSAAAGGVFLALAFLAGQPLFAAIGAAMYVIIRRKWRDAGVGGGIAFALSAIQLLPFLLMLRGTEGRIPAGKVKLQVALDDGSLQAFDATLPE